MREQAANAKAAFKQTLGEVFSGLGHGVSPKDWTQAHPWVMLSASAVAGFTTACLAVPSKEQAAMRRLARLEKVFRDNTSDNQHRFNGHDKPKKGLLSVLVAELIRTGTAVATSLIRSGAVGPVTPTKAPEPGSNGPSESHPS